MDLSLLTAMGPRPALQANSPQRCFQSVCTPKRGPVLRFCLHCHLGICWQGLFGDRAFGLSPSSSSLHQLVRISSRPRICAIQLLLEKAISFPHCRSCNGFGKNLCPLVQCEDAIYLCTSSRHSVRPPQAASYQVSVLSILIPPAAVLQEQCP